MFLYLVWLTSHYMIIVLGTGKTMVARVLGRLLHMVGVLPTDKVTEVQRTDLVGEFVGHTGPKTRRKVCYMLWKLYIIIFNEKLRTIFF